MTLMEQVKELCRTDSIVAMAFRVHGDDVEAVCAALLAHAAENKRLIEALIKFQMTKPVTIKVEEYETVSGCKKGELV